MKTPDFSVEKAKALVHVKEATKELAGMLDILNEMAMNEPIQRDAVHRPPHVLERMEIEDIQRSLTEVGNKLKQML